MKALNAAFVWLLTLPALANANLITNGSFENPVVNDQYQTIFAGDTFGGWTVSQGSVDLAFGIWNAADGRQSVDMVGTPGVGIIFQDIQTQVGQAYNLSFAVAPTPLAFTYQLRAIWGSVELPTIIRTGVTQNPPAPYAISYEYLNFMNLVATSNVTRLEFQSINAPTQFQGMISCPQ